MSAMVRNAGIAMALGCSLSGEVPASEVLRLAEACLTEGADIVGVADTVGYAGPRQVATLCAAMSKLCGDRPFIVHLHDTRGTGIMNRLFHGYAPYAGVMEGRHNGSLISNVDGETTQYALFALQERGAMFIAQTTEVYEGMIVGENARSEDLDVNATKEKKLTNMRAASADSFENLVPPRKLTLEESLEFAAEDECVEVTPQIVRIRKVILDANERKRAHSKAKSGK